MRKTLRITATLAATAVLAACSQSESVNSTLATSPPEVTTSASAASTSSTPSSTSTTTVPVTTTVVTQAEVLDIPTLPPPEIDGILGEGEWIGAATFSMSDGAGVQLLQANGTLYVAVAGSELGAVNVVLAMIEEVWILHSSAALGSALYEPDNQQWQLSHGFSWCCRNRNDDTDRLALLDQEGWQANIGFTGDAGTVEFQIALPWQGSLIAVSSIRDDDDTGFWPTDLSDEARSQLLGPPPPTHAFNTIEWQPLQERSD